MNTYGLIARISFLIVFLIGIWTRHCIDGFKGLLENRGEDPNQDLRMKKMRELDPALFRQWQTGLTLQLICGVIFIVTGLLAFTHR